MAQEREVLIKKGEPYYAGSTVPKRARRDIKEALGSLVMDALSTPVDPVAAAEAQRRIAFLSQPPRTGGITGFPDL